MNVTDTELKSELQNLYLVSKHWMSDLEFVEDEIRFLKSLVSRYWRFILQSDDLIEVQELNVMLMFYEENIPGIKSRIREYLRFIELLITNKNSSSDFDIKESFNPLKLEVIRLSGSIRTLKNSYFILTEKLSPGGNKAD